MTTTFTTILVRRNTPIFLPCHLYRLQYQCLALGNPFELERVTSLIQQAVQEQSGSFAVRVSMFVDGKIECRSRELPVRKPLTASVALWQQHPKALDYLKHTCRQNWTAVRRKSGTEEIVWVDKTRHLLECINGNVFQFQNGLLCTPKTDGRILPGIMRTAVLVFADESGIVVTERRVPYSPDANLFLSSSLRGLVPLSLGECSVTPIMEQFMQNLWGRIADEYFQNQVYERFISQSWKECP